jgi:hypothetical protein
MFPTLYKVTYGIEEAPYELTVQGIIYADNIIDATQKIADWYGKDDIAVLEVHLMEHQLAELTEAEYNRLLTFL